MIVLIALWSKVIFSCLYASTTTIITQPTFQRWINVVSTLWINVEMTLIRRWKWNKIRRRIFNVAQRWYNVSAWRWNNADTKLFQPSVDVSDTYIESNRASGDCGLCDIVHVKYINSFYSAIWESIFYYILTIELLMKYQKIF